MKPFFDLKSVEQVLERISELEPLDQSESLPLAQARGRSLAADFTAPEDLPGFTRSTMDGYALRARDTFGASEESPAYAEIVGEVRMGQAPDFKVGPGQCAVIGTGGMLPQGADAVLMVEHSRRLDDTTVEISKSVAPGANLLGPTDDAAQGQVLLPAGQRLRPQDLGLMAGLGLSRVEVVKRPRVGIVSTGDEVVPVDTRPGPGQVRDVNTYTLAAQVEQAGGEPVIVGLVPDNQEKLRQAVARSLETCQLTLLSGGSSVGTRDLTLGVFHSFAGAKLLVHGVSVSPGKPFIWVQAGDRQLLGLPGQVASCMVTFHLFADPMLERLQGRPARPFSRFARLPARLVRNLPSAAGREEYVRVRAWQEDDGSWLAEPIFGKSGLITTLTRGQGLVRVPRDQEGLYPDEPVTVLLFP